MDLPGYVQLALRSESELNALAIYMWYHLRAVAAARSIASANLPPAEYAQAARAALESCAPLALQTDSPLLRPNSRQSICVASSPVFMHLSAYAQNTSGDAFASPEVLPFLVG